MSELLCLEPRLGELEREVDGLRDDGQRPWFCSNFLWLPINTRLRLVSHLKRCKQDRGLAFFDPERERLMIRELTQANGGPLSPEGLRELYAVIFDLTKREVSRD